MRRLVFSGIGLTHRRNHLFQRWKQRRHHRAVVADQRIGCNCNDPWGSNPATSSGGAAGFTQLTPALQSLMTQANMAPEFMNYRLDGVQTDFTTANGAPTFLGNSVIEGENVGMKKNTASCITCHSESQHSQYNRRGRAAVQSSPGLDRA
jgi:hypothetical protein